MPVQDKANKLTAELARVGNMREFYVMAEQRLKEGSEADSPARIVGENAGSHIIMMDEATVAGKAALESMDEQAIDDALESLKRFQ